MNLPLPFASKELPNGKKLFRRKIGYTFTLPASSDYVQSITVPYSACKINEAEVLWAPEGVTVDMKVKDTPAGSYTGVANALLNQYGTNVVIASDFFRDISPYDADVYLGMVLEFTFHNSSATSKVMGLNIVFHEVV
jgi:hypothetical protein